MQPSLRITQRPCSLYKRTCLVAQLCARTQLLHQIADKSHATALGIATLLVPSASSTEHRDGVSVTPLFGGTETRPGCYVAATGVHSGLFCANLHDFRLSARLAPLDPVPGNALVRPAGSLEHVALVGVLCSPNLMGQCTSIGPYSYSPYCIATNIPGHIT